MDAVQAYLRSRLAQCAVTPFAADDAADYEAVAVRYLGRKR
mgnify:CR=1 FL=1